MGVMLTELLENAPDVELAGLVTEPGRGQPAGIFHPRLPLLGQDRMADHLPSGCVVVDFSLAGALDGLLKAGRRLGAALVVGTTGFDEAGLESLRAYAEELPVVRAANFSVGIPALRLLIQLLGRTLPEGFDAEQVETHHITKKDRPSGTALDLALAYAETRGGREVPIHSQRLGGVVGEHTWTFSDQDETLVLTHRAHSRRAFLRGVLPAVRFVHGRKAGYYGLQDVLLDLGGQAGA